MKYRGFSTRAIHVGQEPDPTTGAVIPPLHLSSTYAQEAPGHHRGFEYSRTNNPTRQAWERNIAALEEGSEAIAFASGMAAIDAVVRLLRPGDHIVASDDLYGGTFRLFERVWSHFHISVTYVDTRMPEVVEAAFRPTTRMLYVETPSNPLLRLADIAALAEAAHRHNAWLVVDNTFATPYAQQPLKLGADVVVHSTTKYLGGHSDIIGGVVVTRNPEIAASLRFLQNAAGAVPSPFECWLCLRSVKTLAVRMQQHARSAQALAELCARHPAVRAVYYPGLPDHPQHELARRQMRNFTGMLSIDLGSAERAIRFLQALRIFTLAESLGGVESLASHPATMTHASIPVERRHALGITEGLVRLSCGLEDTEDLLEDVANALELASA
ncbi:MAG: cystathionine gamma-synthase [Chlorobiota bacterium]